MNALAPEVETIAGLPDGDALIGAWEELYAAGHHEPSTSLEWSRTLLQTHVAAEDRVFTMVVREGGRIVAIAPVVIQREKIAGPFQVATLTPLSEKYRTHSDVLGECHRPEIIGALFGAFAALPCAWDFFRVGRVLESGRLAAGLKGFLGSDGLKRRMRREFPSFQIPLTGSYESFLAGRSSKFRNYLRRKLRQLQALGKVEVLRVGHGLDLDRAFEDLLAVDGRSWKHAHGTAITAVPRQQTFYRNICEESLRRGRLHLTIMYLDGRPIAFNLGLLQGDRYYYLKTSYDETFRQAGVATVFRARLVESLIGEGMKWLDFPGEPYQWEEQWTDDSRWHESYLVFNRGAHAFLCRMSIALRDLFQSRSGREGIRYVDPRTQRAE